MFWQCLSVVAVGATPPIYLGYREALIWARIAERQSSREFREVYMLFEARRGFISGFKKGLPTGAFLAGSLTIAFSCKAYFAFKRSPSPRSSLRD